MTIKKRKVLFLLLFAGIIIGTGFLFYRNQIKIAEAGAGQNVTGYAWSSNIGWISMNSLNCDANGDGLSEGNPPACPPVGTAIPNYGANIDSSGNFFGYAWSSNIGWIEFNPSGPYPGLPNYSAKLDKITGALSGWARALSTDASWDGWIKLDGVSVNKISGDFSGYAWGSDVIGWISFSGANYQTRTSFDFNTAPTDGGLSVEPGDYCSYPLHPTLRWVFSDPDSGDYQDAYNVQIDDDSNVAENPLTDSCLPSPGTCSTGHTASSYSPLTSFAYNSTYYWRVKTADNHLAWSPWSSVDSFTTPVHAYPHPDFKTVSQKFAEDEFVQFCSTLQAEVCSQNVSLCYNVSGQTISCSGKIFSWTFPSGTQFSTTTSASSENPKVKFASSTPQSVSLTITDNTITPPGACSTSTTINISKPLPKWKEVAP